MGEGAGKIPSPFAGGGEGLSGEAVPVDQIQQEMMEGTTEKDNVNQNKESRNGNRQSRL